MTGAGSDRDEVLSPGATSLRASLPTLLLCLVIIALEGYDIQAFGVAAPHMMVEIGLGPDAQGWIGSAAMFGLIAGAFLGGIIANRVGVRAILICAMVTFGASSILTALTHELSLLLAVRFLAGVGFGAALPLVIAVVGDVAPARHRALAVTMAFCGLPAGAAIVALYSRMMGEVVDWRAIFISGGVPPIVLAPLVLFLIPRLRDVGKVQGGVVHGLLSGGRALSTLMVWLTFATTLFVSYLMLNWLPSLVISKGLSASDGADAAFVFNVASIVGAVALAGVVDRVGFRVPLLAAYIALALVLALMSLARAPGMVLGLSAMAGLLVVGPQCALYALIPLIYPANARVLGAGAAVGMGRFGSILGPLIAGQMRAGGYSADEVFLFLAPVPLLAALAIHILARARCAAAGHGDALPTPAQQNPSLTTL